MAAIAPLADAGRCATPETRVRSGIYMTDYEPAMERLREENALLKLRIADLESRLSFLSQHKTLAAGLSGEQLVSGIIGGVRTVHTASVDIIMDDGKKIEVKQSKLSYPSPNKPGNRARWQ